MTRPARILTLGDLARDLAEFVYDMALMVRDLTRIALAARKDGREDDRG